METQTDQPKKQEEKKPEKAPEKKPPPPPLNGEILRYKFGEIFKAIPKIMKAAPGVGKTEENTQQNFKFRGIEGVYNALNKIMAEHEVFTTQRMARSSTQETKSRSGGTGTYIKNRYVFRFWHSDGSFIETMVDGEAIDYGDKASNKALSIGHKYALVTTLCLPYDVPEPDRESPASEIPQRPNPTEKQIDPTKTKVNQNHLKSLYATMPKKKWVKDTLKEICKMKYGVDSSKDLTIAQFNQVMQMVNKQTMEEASKQAIEEQAKKVGK